MGNIKAGDLGIVIGSGKRGERDQITDVPGVRVGNKTVVRNRPDGSPLYNTGVTAIFPCDGFVFDRKPVAAAFVLNGFGKSLGTVQINELGTLETPIVLTNTLNVGKAADALTEYMILEGEKRGETIHSVNAVVGETNDSGLNTIQDRAVTKEDVFSALESAGKDFEEGAVGAGRGTVCCDLKGGIGSASRVLSFDGKQYTLGVLVQSNFGSLADLMIAGEPVGKEIEEKYSQVKATEDVGSIMMVLGTDIPLTHRQLMRVLKRMTVGLVRTGSFMGHGSGDVFLGFSNGNFMGNGKELLSLQAFPEGEINQVFRMAAEAAEEAVVNSLLSAETVKGADKKTVHCLLDFWKPEKKNG